MSDLIGDRKSVNWRTPKRSDSTTADEARNPFQKRDAARHAYAEMTEGNRVREVEEHREENRAKWLRSPSERTSTGMVLSPEMQELRARANEKPAPPVEPLSSENWAALSDFFVKKHAGDDFDFAGSEYNCQTLVNVLNWMILSRQVAAINMEAFETAYSYAIEHGHLARKNPKAGQSAAVPFKVSQVTQSEDRRIAPVVRQEIPAEEMQRLRSMSLDELKAEAEKSRRGEN